MNKYDKRVIKQAMRPSLPLYQRGLRVFEAEGKKGFDRFLYSLSQEEIKELARETIVQEVDQINQMFIKHLWEDRLSQLPVVGFSKS